MSKWSEFPLRPQLKAWPGLNTRGGKLMSIGGEMDDCTNVIINREDILEKRKGLVRGIDERFNGVVCGLFKYTDHCGIERIVIADEDGFSIRQPFTVPLFETADCYPFDAFELNNGDDLDGDNWRNTSRYQIFSGRMTLKASAASQGAAGFLPDLSARWFKDACSRSYQLLGTYQFDTTAGVATQIAYMIMRGFDDLSTGALLLAELRFKLGGDYRIKLYRRDAGGGLTLNSQATMSGNETGTINLQYDQTTRIATFTCNPVNGPLQRITSGELNVIEDADLGLTSAIGLSYDSDGFAPDTDFGFSVIDGGPI